MDVDLLPPAGGKQGVDDPAGEALPPVRIEGEHAVHLQSVGVAGAAGCRGKHAVDECTEDAFVFRVGLLVPVVGPDLLGEREFGRGQFADGGGGHGVDQIILVFIRDYERQNLFNLYISKLCMYKICLIYPLKSQQ